MKRICKQFQPRKLIHEVDAILLNSTAFSSWKRFGGTGADKESMATQIVDTSPSTRLAAQVFLKDIKCNSMIINDTQRRV